MLDAAVLAEQRVVEARDVADGPHVLDAGLEALVDDHAVVDLEAAVLEPTRRRRDADADDRELGLDDASARRLDGVERRASAERLHLVAEHELDAFTRVQVGEELHQLARAQDLEQALAAVHERHFEPELLQRRRDLHADEPRADHDRVPRATRRIANRRRVAERAQRVDAFEIGAGNVEATRRGAARDQQLVERALAPAFEEHAASLQVEGRRRRPRARPRRRALRRTPRARRACRRPRPHPAGSAWRAAAGDTGRTSRRRAA